MNQLSFFVPGTPKPGGSKTGFYSKKLNRVLIVDASKNQDWKASIKSFAMTVYDGIPWTCPIVLTVEFRVTRPRCHYGSGKNSDRVKESSPPYPLSKPDSTKLLRCLEDALTGIIWRDDSQIVEQHVYKNYAVRPGAAVTVREKLPVEIPLT